jgi:hypothetical protein
LLWPLLLLLLLLVLLLQLHVWCAKRHGVVRLLHLLLSRLVVVWRHGRWQRRHVIVSVCAIRSDTGAQMGR